ncbi:MAG: hypothetical protein J6T14_03655, partial [Clostridia bacterium]|nr:hypothetical protein [Clostridia bacterium]
MDTRMGVLFYLTNWNMCEPFCLLVFVPCTPKTTRQTVKNATLTRKIWACLSPNYTSNCKKREFGT